MWKFQLIFCFIILLQEIDTFWIASWEHAQANVSIKSIWLILCMPICQQYKIFEFQSMVNCLIMCITVGYVVSKFQISFNGWHSQSHLTKSKIDEKFPKSPQWKISWSSACWNNLLNFFEKILIKFYALNVYDFL